MAEWLKAAVLKTVEGNTSGGSNPSLPATKLQKIKILRLLQLQIVDLSLLKRSKIYNKKFLLLLAFAKSRIPLTHLDPNPLDSLLGY